MFFRSGPAKKKNKVHDDALIYGFFGGGGVLYLFVASHP